MAIARYGKTPIASAVSNAVYSTEAFDDLTMTADLKALEQMLDIDDEHPITATQMRTVERYLPVLGVHAQEGIGMVIFGTVLATLAVVAAIIAWIIKKVRDRFVAALAEWDEASGTDEYVFHPSNPLDVTKDNIRTVLASAEFEEKAAAIEAAMAASPIDKTALAWMLNLPLKSTINVIDYTYGGHLQIVMSGVTGDLGDWLDTGISTVKNKVAPIVADLEHAFKENDSNISELLDKLETAIELPEPEIGKLLNNFTGILDAKLEKDRINILTHRGTIIGSIDYVVDLASSKIGIHFDKSSVEDINFSKEDDVMIPVSTQGLDMLDKVSKSGSGEDWYEKLEAVEAAYKITSKRLKDFDSDFAAVLNDVSGEHSTRYKRLMTQLTRNYALWNKYVGKLMLAFVNAGYHVADPCYVTNTKSSKTALSSIITAANSAMLFRPRGDIAVERYSADITFNATDNTQRAIERAVQVLHTVDTDIQYLTLLTSGDHSIERLRDDITYSEILSRYEISPADGIYASEKGFFGTIWSVIATIFGFIGSLFSKFFGWLTGKEAAISKATSGAASSVKAIDAAIKSDATGVVSGILNGVLSLSDDDATTASWLTYVIPQLTPFLNAVNQYAGDKGNTAMARMIVINKTTKTMAGFMEQGQTNYDSSELLKMIDDDDTWSSAFDKLGSDGYNSSEIEGGEDRSTYLLHYRRDNKCAVLVENHCDKEVNGKVIALPAHLTIANPVITAELKRLDVTYPDLKGFASMLSDIVKGADYTEKLKQLEINAKHIAAYSKSLEDIKVKEGDVKAGDLKVVISLAGTVAKNVSAGAITLLNDFTSTHLAVATATKELLERLEATVTAAVAKKE